MKKNIIITIIIVIVLCLTIVIAKNVIDYKIFRNDEKQVKMLMELFSNYTKEIDFTDCELKIDDTCLKNIFTKQYFSDENKSIIKSIEIANEDSIGIYNLFLYSSDDGKTIKLVLEKKGIEGFGSYRKEQNFKVKIKNGNIIFEPYGLIKYSES